MIKMCQVQEALYSAADQIEELDCYRKDWSNNDREHV